MTDLETWVLDNSERVYRYWVYKRLFTPLEQAEKYVDQSCYESETCSRGIIKEVVELPDGDVLIGFVDPADNGTAIEGYIDYQKLSEITMAFSPTDMENEDA